MILINNILPYRIEFIQKPAKRVIGELQAIPGIFCLCVSERVLLVTNNNINDMNIKYFLHGLFLLTLFFQNYIMGGYRNFERIEWMWSVNRGVFPGYPGATLVIGGGEKYVRDTN